MLSVGRYQLLETLGEGGMGVVYKALDPLIGRTVAVKLISARLTESPELRQRFFSEARAAGQLSHRNIVTIFDLGEDSGHPYFAMEYLEGRNLRVRLQSFERMSLSRKLEIMGYLCEGLAYAHSRGITHRDIKPANVFITDAGEVKILDFGLARLPASELTHSKTLIGTLNYMAPEQIAGEKIDHRTDIFAVGVVFYETLSGRSPFEADSVAALLNKILRDEPQPLGALDSSIPPRLNALVARAMAKAKEDRYQSLNELLIDLAECRALIRDSDAGSGNWAEDLDVTRPVPAGGTRLRPASSGSHPQVPRNASDATPRTPLPASPSPATGGPGSGTSVPAVPPRRKAGGWVIAAGLVAVVGLAAAATRLAWPPRPDTGPRHQTERAVTSQAAPLTGPQPPRVEPSPGPGSSPAEAGDSQATPQQGTAGRTWATAGAPAPPGRSTAGSAIEARIAADRRDAEEAREAARSAMQGADAANAADLASATYRAAADRAASAGGLFVRGQFALAAERSREAGNLFRRSEIEALAEEERRSQAVRPSAQPEATPAVPPAVPPAPPPASPLAATGSPSPVVPPGAVSAPSPAAPAGAPADGAIRELLARYAEALESRDLASLKRIWPGLSGTQERALRDEFEQAKSIAVRLDDPAIQLANGTATVVCRRRYELITQDGHHLESRNTSFFSLRHQGSGWVIESVKHDAPR